MKARTKQIFDPNTTACYQTSRARFRWFNEAVVGFQTRFAHRSSLLDNVTDRVVCEVITQGSAQVAVLAYRSQKSVSLPDFCLVSRFLIPNLFCESL